jgi:hypothetical protein
MADAGTPHVHEDEEQVDSCTCDIEFDESDVFSDAELPPAAGGVQAAGEAPGDEDGIDGCDVDCNGPDVTTDDELPITVGGVRETVLAEKT